MSWRVHDSRYALRERWITVRADTCETPSGVVLDPYYVLEFPDFVHALVLDRDGGVILVDQYRHGLGARSLELPGGVMDPGETDPVETALREVREETGYVAGHARLVASRSVDAARIANRVHLVVMEDAEPTAVPSPEPAEDITVRRLGIADAVASALSGGIVNAAHVGLLLTGLQAAGRVTIGAADRG